MDEKLTEAMLMFYKLLQVEMKLEVRGVYCYKRVVFLSPIVAGPG